ncbi:PTS system D-fructose-specific IIA component (F1P-forming) (Frc family) /PTS system D-fructose-specific IIB component (F1P-forming) (Frc family) /PTS system D-fructose-specific IIC component (F1P-forming) (Frc family) [Microbacterium sp. AG1240]|uniref:PTS fructose transporter subunit IIABC n=1 Tax=Microbacterium sp. AG1240 TaxID=2183992 RepID=UPI000EB423F1|nr:fructose-specific PTS transporter subunit EIIC [Microbacterium sp. AG1240]RKT36662.1 PTS system D-fructose-specific IIA component (F1P-forming) (Frc family) /PTS system D-fructose-specific IIB component (F1P-forming) (Frc family) /PTS system D-fructose-specific IIC component (F1P-forming) (Frc family) [Microbacterium sp. AG1240]
MSRIITPELVSLDVPLGDGKADVIRALAERVVANGRARDADELFADAWAREEKDETGLPGGIGIPHARSASVTEPTLAFARLTPGVDFGAPDGPADIVFLIAAPAGADEAHLAVLSQLARSLMNPDFMAGLRAASTPEQAVGIVSAAIEPAPAAAAEPAPAATRAEARTQTSSESSPTRIVAVTACATGIAHTFMAADALTAAGKEEGVDLIVEPQGSSGYKALPQSVIDNADAVIFATDVDVREPQRFAGKPVVRSGVKRGIEQPKQLIAEAIAASKNPNAARVTGDATSVTAETAPVSWGARIQRILLTGVSYMIPFVAGGGLLIALGFLLGGFEVTTNAATVITQNSLWDLPTTDITSPIGPLGQYLGSVAFMIGATSMGFLVSALAGYIAFAIADRPGIAPGFVAGAVAVLMNAGFIGGIIGGLLAGFIAWWLGRLNVPRFLRGLMPVVIIPLLGSIVASGLMVLFLGRPIAALMTVLTDWLTSMSQSGVGAVLLGVILGLMMCFDLGGPVNKVAYAFATAGLAAATVDNTAPYLIMAAVMSAGMVPPLAMALASTVLARKSFTPVERENGVAAWLLGASFISEGAIPFAAADPLRVIPASMVGGAVTGALSMAFSVQSYAPHGGLFVFFAINPIWGFLISIVAGTVVSALLVVALKKWVGRKELNDAEAPQLAAVPA